MELKQTQDICVEKLTSTEGVDLEIMANITHSSQINAIMEGYNDMALGSEYGVGLMQLLLRITCSYQGRARTDLTTIGSKQAGIPGWVPGGMGNDHRD